jgi:hypothetical protein
LFQSLPVVLKLLVSAAEEAPEKEEFQLQIVGHRYLFEPFKLLLLRANFVSRTRRRVLMVRKIFLFKETFGN